MKMVLTGAKGFIGTHLEHRLIDDGHSVAPVDPKYNFSTIKYDSLLQLTYSFRPDIIIHLGANCSTSRSLNNPRSDFLDNALGTVNVCEVSKVCGNIPIVFTSTVKIYPGFDGLVSPLGLSKQTAEAYLSQYRVPYIINRPSTIYGPGQDGDSESGWVSWFVRASIENREILLAGDGSQSRDILYIQDFIELLVDQIENFESYQGRSYDIGGGVDNEVSLTDLLKLLKYTNVRTVSRLPGDLQRVVVDNSDITNVRGWMPTTSWKKGVQLTRESLK
jgi:CDP-paratose 2-epimerase